MSRFLLSRYENVKNYNACNYNDGSPVTIRFAEKVGDILVMGSAKGAERQPFKFYI